MNQIYLSYEGQNTFDLPFPQDISAHLWACRLNGEERDAVMYTLLNAIHSNKNTQGWFQMIIP